MNLKDFVTHGMGLGDLAAAIKHLVAEVQELKRDAETARAVSAAVLKVLQERAAADRAREEGRST